MKTKINNTSELEVGDLLLIDNPLLGEDLASVVNIHDTLKYPITDSNGNKQRSLGRVDGSIKFITPEEEGCKGDEEIKEYLIVGKKGGSYTLKEGDDYSEWNIRKISEDHPKYDNSIKEGTKKMNNLINDLAKMFGDNGFN